MLWRIGQDALLTLPCFCTLVGIFPHLCAALLTLPCSFMFELIHTSVQLFDTSVRHNGNEVQKFDEGLLQLDVLPVIAI